MSLRGRTQGTKNAGRMGTDQAVAADPGVIQNARAHADQRAVTDAAAVQGDQMSDGDQFTDHERCAGVRVQH